MAHLPARPKSQTANVPAGRLAFRAGTLLLLLLPLPPLATGPALVAEEPRRVSATEALPFGQKPVDYWSLESNDPVAALQRRIEHHELELPFAERFGYLPAILQELEIPVESQLLTFSSQSPHRNAIRPERPRAVYFNEDVSVAWFPGAVLLEIAAHDSQKGTLFYTVVNREEAPPEFRRSSSQTCLGCHHMPGNPSSTGVAVPGHLLRAEGVRGTVETRRPGEAAAAVDSPSGTLPQQPLLHVRSHALPLDERWQSWYVTGIAPDQRHRGNLSQSEDRRRKDDDPDYYRVVADLAEEFDTDRYPIDTSDVVAHLVFDHQMLGLNLLARLSYEHQFGVKSDVEDRVVRYLLLADEAPLNQPVFGTSRFAVRYQKRGPNDPSGRSLYDLDLQTRLYRHRVSPLVNCRLVQGFPKELKQRLFGRLHAALTNREALDGVELADADRQATLAVLKATVADWPGD